MPQELCSGDCYLTQGTELPDLYTPAWNQTSHSGLSAHREEEPFPDGQMLSHPWGGQGQDMGQSGSGIAGAPGSHGL